MMETIPALFKEKAKNFPNHLAINTINKKLTYANLYAQAEQYKAPDEQVVIINDKNPEFLYSNFLGIMLQCKAYFYLDPDLPDSIKKTLRETIHFKNKILSKAIGFLVQTSGTTQAPRLLGLTHKSVLHNIKHYQQSLQITPQDKLGLLTTPQFTAANSTIYAALLSGACLCPFSIKDHDIHTLIHWAVKEAITVLHLTPSLLRLLAKFVSPHDLPQLRAIKIGGETLYPADVELFRKKFHPDCVLVNGLGMSEIGGNISHFIINKQTHIAADWKVVPVGKILSGHEVMLIENQITIRSPYLAIDPWEACENIGVKTFKTNDIGYFDEEGMLFHTGRLHRMIKRNGYRMELNVIESALIEISGVENAYVLFYENKLVAFVTSSSQTLTTLQQILGKTLPSYMIPQKIIVLPYFPLTASGKINQKKLQQLIKINDDQGFVGPRNEIELIIQVMWQKILSLDHISMYDNFFELGGDSLKTMEFIARMQRDHHLTLTLSAMTVHPSIAEIANSISIKAPLRNEFYIELLPLKKIDNALSPIIFIPGGMMSEKEIILYAALLPFLNQSRSYMTLRANLSHPQLPNTLTTFAELVANAIKSYSPTKTPIIISECIASVLAVELSGIIAKNYSSPPVLILLNPWCPRDAKSSHYLSRFTPTPYRGDAHIVMAEDILTNHTDSLNYWSSHLQGHCQMHMTPGNSHSYIRLYQKQLATMIDQIITTDIL